MFLDCAVIRNTLLKPCINLGRRLGAIWRWFIWPLIDVVDDVVMFWVVDVTVVALSFASDLGGG